MAGLGFVFAATSAYVGMNHPSSLRGAVFARATNAQKACFVAPCPQFSVRNLNSTKSDDVMKVDLATGYPGSAALEQGRTALVADDLLVHGFTAGDATQGKVFEASNFFVNAKAIESGYASGSSCHELNAVQGRSCGRCGIQRSACLSTGGGSLAWSYWGVCYGEAPHGISCPKP
jgi:hypothetical protein